MTDIHRQQSEEFNKLSQNTQMAREEEDEMEHEHNDHHESSSEDEQAHGVIATVADTTRGLATGAAAVVGMGAGAVVGTVQFGVNTVSNAAHAVTDGVSHAVGSVVETATNTAAAAAGKAKDLTLGAAELVGEGAGLAANTVSAVAAAPGAVVGGVVHAAEAVKDTAANLVGLGKTESTEDEEKDEKTEKDESPEESKEEKSEDKEEKTDDKEKKSEKHEEKEKKSEDKEEETDKAAEKKEVHKEEPSKTKEEPIPLNTEFDKTDAAQPANLDPCLMPTLMPELRDTESQREPEPAVEEPLKIKEVEPIRADPSIDGVHPVADLPKTFADAVKEGEEHHETPGLPQHYQDREMKKFLNKQEFPALDGATPVNDLPMTFASAVREDDQSHLLHDGSSSLATSESEEGQARRNSLSGTMSWLLEKVSWKRNEAQEGVDHQDAKVALAETAFLLGSAATLIEVLKSGTGSIVGSLQEDLDRMDEDSMYGPDREVFDYSFDNRRRSLY